MSPESPEQWIRKSNAISEATQYEEEGKTEDKSEEFKQFIP